LKSGTGRLSLRKPDAEDEWAHLTNSDENETIIKDKDTAEAGERKIFIGNNKEAPWEIVEEKTKNLVDMTSNVSQYVRLVNAYLQEQQNQVVKIKNSKNKFDLEIKSLQNDNARFTKLNDVQTDNLDKNGLKKFAQKLTQVRDTRKTQINQLKTEMTKTEDEIKNQDMQIKKIYDQIKEKEKT